MDRQESGAAKSRDIGDGLVQASDTPPIRYAKLGYVALGVTDIEASRHFYCDLLGLELTGSGPEGELFLRCSGDHHNIILYPSARAGLRRVAFQVESEADLDRLTQLARDEGLNHVEVDKADCEVLRQGRSIRFVEPITGAPLEFFARQQSDLTFTSTVADIQRLGHVVMMTPAYEQAVDFFLKRMNFRCSDAIGERVCFMRCFPNPLHHSFGIGRGPSRGLHHINFMVSHIDDIGKALWRMQNNGVEIVYGPGRHPPSDSVFLYFSDPDGITCEYSFGMEEFPEQDARAPRSLPQVQESSDAWGGPPPRIQPALIESDEEPLVDVAAVGIV